MVSNYNFESVMSQADRLPLTLSHTAGLFPPSACDVIAYLNGPVLDTRLLLEPPGSPLNMYFNHQDSWHYVYYCKAKVFCFLDVQMP